MNNKLIKDTFVIKEIGTIDGFNEEGTHFSRVEPEKPFFSKNKHQVIYQNQSK
jgi:hypothetical protein